MDILDERARREGRTVTRATLSQAARGCCATLSYRDSKDVVDGILFEIADALMRGEDVKLHGFGKFSVRRKREGMARSARSGAEAPIPAGCVVKFQASRILLGQMNEEPDRRSQSTALIEAVRRLRSSSNGVRGNVSIERGLHDAGARAATSAKALWSSRKRRASRDHRLSRA